tara:strand:+ start:236 stop:340 length:105 start_codon:yes stop_codon:yes gene_type:complete
LAILSTAIIDLGPLFLLDFAGFFKVFLLVNQPTV